MSLGKWSCLFLLPNCHPYHPMLPLSLPLVTGGRLGCELSFNDRWPHTHTRGYTRAHTYTRTLNRPRVLSAKYSIHTRTYTHTHTHWSLTPTELLCQRTGFSESELFLSEYSLSLLPSKPRLCPVVPSSALTPLPSSLALLPLPPLPANTQAEDATPSPRLRRANVNESRRRWVYFERACAVV